MNGLIIFVKEQNIRFPTAGQVLCQLYFENVAPFYITKLTKIDKI